MQGDLGFSYYYREQVSLVITGALPWTLLLTGLALINLQDKMGLALIFITHDIALARKVSDRMAVMHKGQIVEVGATNEILIHPQHPYTRRLVDCASGRYEIENGEIEMVAEPEEETVALEKYC